MATLPAEVDNTQDQMPMADAQENTAKKPFIKSDFLQGLAELDLARQLGLMIGLAASIAMGFAVVLWSQQEEFLPLQVNLERMEPQAVMNILDTNAIKYKIDAKTGTMLVVADQIHNARLKLASEGMIGGDEGFGFEILEKEQPLGSSQFMENVRWRRSLEGELARTIKSIRAVQSARVHLAIPKPTAFLRDSRKPSASVLVNLFSGSQLNQSQVEAITNLVAASIPEMDASAVKVVDQRGNLLSKFDNNDDLALANRQLEYTQELENRINERIHSILEPLLGMDRFRAQVSADVDFTEVEQADEIYNPDVSAVRSEQTLVEGRAGGAAGGVPGALTNQPPANGDAPEVAETRDGGAAEAGGSQRRQATRNYELDRSISYTRHQVGKLQRLSVAVVVDNASIVDPETGEAKTQALSEDTLERLTILVRDAVGFDASRGDRVNVINSEFNGIERGEELPYVEPPLWQQPWVISLAKQLIGVFVVLLIVFVVLRPTMKRLSEASKAQRELEAQRELDEMTAKLEQESAAQAALENSTGGEAMLGADGELLLPSPEKVEDQLLTIKEFINEDPARASQVLQQWIKSDDDE